MSTGLNTGFGNLGIAPKLLEILDKNKFTTPTPIQLQSIPPAIQGKDLMGIAQTGTGKTLAFGVPMIQRLAQSEGRMKGLIILPTRELAQQVNETLKKIGHTLGLKTALLIGGEAIGRQIRALRDNPHIIIATPGRLNDHLDSKNLDLSKTGILVLDEADRMLDMGFAPQIKRILNHVPKNRQTMLFSATMPDSIVKIAQAYMLMPLRVEVAPSGTAVSAITQELFFVDGRDKPIILESLLQQYQGSVLVFCRTKHGVKRLTMNLKRSGHSAAEIHSNRSLGQRTQALEGFKLGRYRILVATDIAARGIDVTGIELVINYDLPGTAEDYVHRIGRTGRAGRVGRAISFATSDQRGDVRAIERLIKKTLPVTKPDLPPGFKLPPQEPYSRFSEAAFKRPRRGFSHPSQRSGQGFAGRGRGQSSGPSRSRTPRRDFPRRRQQTSSEGGYFMQRRGN